MSDGTPRTTTVVRLVASREIRERLRAKSFPILTGILVLIILAMGVVGRIAGDDSPSKLDVGAVEPVPAGFGDALSSVAGAFDREAEVRSFSDVSPARGALEDGDVDVVVVGADGRAIFDDTVDDETLAVLQQAWASVVAEGNLVDAGLDPAEVAAALSVEPLAAETLEGDEDTGLAILTGTVAAILLFMALQTFGGYVLTGVVEEKSTAVVELLLVRVRADQLLAGKVLGIGVTAILQFGAAVAAGVGALAISGTDVPGPVWSAVPSMLVWFLLGYLLYSTLYALAGSLVSRQEDAQAASAPIITAMVGAYMLVFFFGYVPESTASRVLSVIPPIAPFLMPMRMASGAASVLEIAASLVLLVGAVVLAWKLTARIYEQVLLHRGSRIPWRTALSFAGWRGGTSS